MLHWDAEKMNDFTGPPMKRVDWSPILILGQSVVTECILCIAVI